MARSTLERFARSTLERNQHTVPWRSRAGEMAPKALAKASRGLGGCGCGGAPAGLRRATSGGCGGLGLGLGPGGNAVHQHGIRPPVCRLGVETPEVQQDRPGQRPGAGLAHPINPPQAKPLPAVGNESPVGGRPLIPLGGEDVGLRQLKHLPPHFGGDGVGGTSPHGFPGPGNSRCQPHDPLTTPRRRGLSRWRTPPFVHPYPPPRPQQPVVQPHQQKPESPYRTLRRDEEGVSRFGGWGQATTAGSHGTSWRAPASLDPIIPLSH